jgi:hypothetical protein
LRVGDLGDFAAIGFKDDRRLVAQAALDVAVQAVVGSIQGAIFKPFEERRVAFVQHFGERGFPADQATRLLGPEAFVIGFSLLAQRIVGGHPGNGGALGKVCRGVVQGCGGLRGAHERCLLGFGKAVNF